MKLRTNCLQRQGMVVPAWLLLMIRSAMFHHALWPLDTPAQAAVALNRKVDMNRDKRDIVQE